MGQTVVGNFVIEVERVNIEGKVLEFYYVRCLKCGKRLAVYADPEIARYSALYWLKCCD